MDIDTTTSTIWPKPISRAIGVLKRPYAVIRGNRWGEIGLGVLLMMVTLAILGPTIAPYDPWAKDTGEMGMLRSMEGPSVAHPLGTTRFGRDILSQALVGAHTALLVGFLTAAIVVTIGTTVGVISGYFGGWVDEVLMRVTDIAYGIPILPFAIVALTILERSIIWIVFVIGLLYWRNSARIIRSDVLALRDQEFIQKAKTTGARDARILHKQVLPNVLPVSFLYFAFATGFAIITAASIAFLGFGDPNQISWGRMIFEAWTYNAVFQQPLWVIVPALMIVLTVVSVYLVGQTYEEVANPRLKKR